MAKLKYDVFISHASEDKVTFVEPLAIALRNWGLKVWFDKFSLKVGDSLRDSIEMGLANSRYGAVIFSPRFLAKKWPKAELNGLFTRQMHGNRNIILPIRHELAAAELARTMPIQADIFSLSSSDGVDSVARSLVEVIRPNLLKLDTKKSIALRANESFIEAAKAKYPAYDFTIHSGEADFVSGLTTAAVRTNTHRIEIKVSNPTLLKESPNIKIGFRGDGASKMLDLMRTGKQQSWGSEEFRYLGTNLPLMPPFAQDGGQLVIGPGKPARPPRFVRLEIGSPDPVFFPLMEMRPTRAGTLEGEIEIGHSKSPLTISMVVRSTGEPGTNFNFSGSLLGHSFTHCEKAIKAIVALVRGATVRVIDIESEKVLMNGSCLPSSPDVEPYPEELRSLVALVAQIEKRFSCELTFPETITEKEEETLRILDCLISGRPYHNGLTAAATIEKGVGEVQAAQRPLFMGEPVMLVQEPANRPDHVELFGKEVSIPPWVLYTEKLVLKDRESEAAAFDEAAAGTELEVELLAQTPTFVRWKDSLKSEKTEWSRRTSLVS